MILGRLRCEGATEPLGVDEARPRLSWQAVERSRRNVALVAAGVLVATDPALLRPGAADIWDGGERTLAGPPLIRYDGPPLAPASRYHWTAWARSERGELSELAEPTWFETGLQDEGNWVSSSWLVAPEERLFHHGYRPVPLFRSEFILDTDPVQARFYISARGLYRAFVNGDRVGNDELQPGFTDYRQLQPYQVYDVSALIHRGTNVLGVYLADGWYCGEWGMPLKRGTFGPVAQLRALLVIDLAAGSRRIVGTDDTWQVSSTEILATNLLFGEIVDARRREPQWSAPGSGGDWQLARIGATTMSPLVATTHPRARVIAELTPVAITSPVFDTFVADFGQNFAGRVRLRVRAERGREIVLVYGEVLNPDGTVYRANLRRAQQEDRYICSGDENGEIFEPWFTMHGFRYVQITDLPGPPTPSHITGVVISCDEASSGELVSSNDLLNRLVENARWGQRSNWTEVPSDCPQRDERLGWLGDARIWSRTALYNGADSELYRKWLRDVRLARSKDGMYPDLAPSLEAEPHDGAPGWSDGGVVLPWTLYWFTGDPSFLDDNFEPMARYVDLLVKENPDLVRRSRLGWNWGDWLSIPEADPEIGRGRAPILDSVYSTTNKELFATAFLARSLQLVTSAAEVLGRSNDAERYGDLTRRCIEAFCATFVRADGSLVGDTQTAAVLALAFGLVEGQRKAAVFEALQEYLRRHQGRLSTGISGTELLPGVLAEGGRLEKAWDLLLNEEYPSWGYQIRRGATTIWERWDGIRPDGSFNDIRMNSFNHPALGSVVAWLYENLGGIACDAPGFFHVTVHPRPSTRVSWCRCRCASPFGEVKVSWNVGEGRQALAASIPVGSSASLWLPAPCAQGDVLLDGRGLGTFDDLRDVHSEGGYVVLEVGSGDYELSAPAR